MANIIASTNRAIVKAEFIRIWRSFANTSQRATTRITFTSSTVCPCSAELDLGLHRYLLDAEKQLGGDIGGMTTHADALSTVVIDKLELDTNSSNNNNPVDPRRTSTFSTSSSRPTR